MRVTTLTVNALLLKSIIDIMIKHHFQPLLHSKQVGLLPDILPPQDAVGRGFDNLGTAAMLQLGRPLTQQGANAEDGTGCLQV